jgi:hypothetical protein
MVSKYAYEIASCLLNAELFDCLVGMPELFYGNEIDGHFYWDRNPMIFTIESIKTPAEYLNSVLYKVHCKSVIESYHAEPDSQYYRMN